MSLRPWGTRDGRALSRCLPDRLSGPSSSCGATSTPSGLPGRRQPSLPAWTATGSSGGARRHEGRARGARRLSGVACREGRRDPPVLALVADEEDASLGSEAVIAALPDLGIRPDLCVIGEPTDLALARSLRGFAVVRVRFAGRAAHSSQAELGVNAVTHLGQFLHAVDERARGMRAAGGDLMVTAAQGGASPFVVPLAPSAWSSGARRRRSPAPVACWPRSPHSWPQSGIAPDANGSAEVVAVREGWQLDAYGPAADLAARLGAELGTGPTFDAPYWIEAPLWQAVCPTLVCGPSGGGLHALDEWVDVRQVQAYAASLPGVLTSRAAGRRAD